MAKKYGRNRNKKYGRNRNTCADSLEIVSQLPNGDTCYGPYYVGQAEYTSGILGFLFDTGCITTKVVNMHPSGNTMWDSEWGLPGWESIFSGPDWYTPEIAIPLGWHLVAQASFELYLEFNDGSSTTKTAQTICSMGDSIQSVCYDVCGGNICGGGCEQGNQVWCDCCDGAPYPGTNSGISCYAVGEVGGAGMSKLLRGRGSPGRGGSSNIAMRRGGGVNRKWPGRSQRNKKGKPTKR